MIIVVYCQLKVSGIETFKNQATTVVVVLVSGLVGAEQNMTSGTLILILYLAYLDSFNNKAFYNGE